MLLIVKLLCTCTITCTYYILKKVLDIYKELNNENLRVHLLSTGFAC